MEAEKSPINCAHQNQRNFEICYRRKDFNEAIPYLKAAIQYFHTAFRATRSTAGRASIQCQIAECSRELALILSIQHDMACKEIDDAVRHIGEGARESDDDVDEATIETSLSSDVEKTLLETDTLLIFLNRRQTHESSQLIQVTPPDKQQVEKGETSGHKKRKLPKTQKEMIEELIICNNSLRSHVTSLCLELDQKDSEMRTTKDQLQTCTAELHALKASCRIRSLSSDRIGQAAPTPSVVEDLPPLETPIFDQEDEFDEGDEENIDES